MRSLSLKLNKVILAAIIFCLLIAAPVFAVGAIDPTYIGVGARPLGMGKAYVAYGEGAETIFFNPAGLGNVKTVKLTSMYTSLLSDVNYLVLGGIYPSPDGSSAFGIGLVSSGVSDIDLYDAGGNLTGNGSWNNNVLMLSYGTDFGALGGIEGLRVGGALKYYSSGGSGSPSVEAGAGSGFDLDVGVLFNPTSWATVGIAVQNALPFSAGGVITRDTGIQEGISSSTKAGLRLNVLGDKDKAISESNQELNIEFDFDYPNLQKDVSSTYHVGAEYWLSPALALRVGMDQDPSPTGTISNPTAGIGVRMAGIAFDYAYHPYADVADDATHFFSLSYVGEEIKTASEPISVAIKNPADKMVTHLEEVEVTGKVLNADYKQTDVAVNGVSAPLDEEGNFTVTLPIEKLGKKLIVIEAKDLRKDEVVATAERRIIRLTSYMDVGEGYWAKSPIEQTGTVGLIQGYPDGTFKPERALTRAELATLLVRANGLEIVDSGTKIFTDVPTDHWASAYVETALKAGYVLGYPDGTFKPYRKISKAEGIAVLARVDGLPLEAEVAIKPFDDVSEKHWAAQYILAAKNSGMLEYITFSRLGPKDSLSRAEAVTMLSKTKFAGAKIKELMSWVTGFEQETKKGTTSVPYCYRELAAR
ncbi:MAG: PorV/PorQ family protein [Candidatus Margulisbacteria bacterium]|nr:PorV/PorQ family protein [Candidatus Margulisiibacteriota bacterium]